jgi:hypothetical protein
MLKVVSFDFVQLLGRALLPRTVVDAPAIRRVAVDISGENARSEDVSRKKLK